MSRPPRRWLDELDAAPDGARELLSAAGAPDQAARDRMWQSLARATAPGAATGTAAATKLSASLFATATAKTIAVVAAVTVVGVALPRRAVTTTPRSPATQRAEVKVVARVSTASSVTVAPTAVVRAVLPTPVEAPLRERAVVPSNVVVRAVTPTSPRPVRTVWAARGARVAVVAAAPVVERPFSLDDELRALTDARAQLRSDPAAALAALESLRARLHGDGVLAHERERFAIEALHRIGRSSEARGRAEAFLASAPTSTMAARVRALRDEIVAAPSIR